MELVARPLYSAVCSLIQVHWVYNHTTIQPTLKPPLIFPELGLMFLNKLRRSYHPPPCPCPRSHPRQSRDTYLGVFRASPPAPLLRCVFLFHLNSCSLCLYRIHLPLSSLSFSLSLSFSHSIPLSFSSSFFLFALFHLAIMHRIVSRSQDYDCCCYCFLLVLSFYAP